MNHSANTRPALPLVYVCFALEAEAVEISLPGVRCVPLFTGIGKVRATMCLTKAVTEVRPAAVINVGTAGATCHRVGDIIAAHHFIDRDQAPLRLPGLEAELTTAHSPLLPHLPSLVGGEKSEAAYLVNTGDDFVTAETSVGGDAFDMEAFAEAWVCSRTGIPFVSVKYITDIIGQNSVRHWEEKLADARTSLSGYFREVCGGRSAERASNL